MKLSTMKNVWILGILICTSCHQNKTSETSVTTSTETSEPIPVEPDGGIGDGALSITNHYINTIEKSHKKDAFLKHKVVSFDFKVSFGGKERLDCKITMLTNSTKVRIDKKNGDQLIYNGDQVFLSPSDANEKGARFDMFTWSYFFAFPYKLDDPGTKWELGNLKEINKVEFQTAKLTFEKGTGDAPDDWYIIYTDTKDNLLEAAAYIVTYGSDGDTAKAEADPHAIHYQDFITIEDIPFATTWKFYGWTETDGFTDQLGEATLSNITFMDNEGTLFEVDQEAKIIKL